MTRFSANLGFMWTDRALPDAIRAAKAAGFDAVECHWPYDVPVTLVQAALAETGLEMLGLNTRRGDVAAGDNGLTALPGREAEAAAAITQTIDYATALGTGAIHVMAGNARGARAHETFVDTLRKACAQVEGRGITLLIEPLNRFDAPDYFLRDTAQACAIIDEVGRPELKLMFDCYHVGRTEGDVIATLRSAWPKIGHIQFASVPDRGRPDQGELEYDAVFKEIARLGWTRPLGAEYRPSQDTNLTLSWMRRWQAKP